ncbi:MAG: Ig-like domain-containing protein, partial [Treponema sp.]|nr:Ig-like domain-containing protein [Treponema sp.]
NVNFNPDIAFPKLDEIANIYSSLLDGAKTRWGYEPNISSNVGQMKSYMQSIRHAMPEYLKTYAKAGNITNVTLSAKHDNIVMNNLSMKINTVSPTASGGTWTGQYFQNGPITVTTNDISGYAFVNWTVTGGTITGGNINTKTITVTLSSSSAEITANYESTAPITNVASISLNKSTMNLTTGNSEKLTATVLPANATYKTVTWISSNPQAATVDQNGNVTAIAAVSGGNGATTVTITAKTADGGKTATCAVTINPAMGEGGWGFSRGSEFNFIIGDTYKFISWMDNSVNRNITFSSSNSSVANVSSDGTITAISNGNAVITCTAVDGNYTKTFNVYVRSGQKLFDLSEVLKDKATQVIDTQAKFNTVFAGSPLQPGGGVGNHVIFEIISEDGFKKLKVTSLPPNWSAGIDLNHNSFNFQPGDIIDIRGKYRSGDGIEGKMCMNMYHMGEALLWDSHSLKNYWDFETSAEIEQQHIDTLLTNTEDQPPSIRIRAKDSGRTFHIDQIRVYRFTD